MALNGTTEHVYNGEVRDADGRLIIAGVNGTATGVATTADPVNSAGTSTPIKFARINASSSGDNTIIAAVALKKIRVIGYVIVAAGTVTATWQDSAGTPNLFGAFPLIANSGVAYAGSLSGPAFDTIAGNGVELNLSGAIAVTGHCSYVEV